MKMVFDRPREMRISREFIEELLFDGRDKYWDGSIQAYCIPVEEVLITEDMIVPWVKPNSNFDEDYMEENRTPPPNNEARETNR